MPPNFMSVSFARVGPRIGATRASPASFLWTRSPRQSLRHASGQGQDPDENPDPQREAQLDREKMDTQANEYSKSGTDAASAAQSDAAFNPNVSNDPEEAKEEAGKGNDVNPLDASPANPHLSQGTSEAEGGAGKKKEGGGDSTGDKH